MLSEKQPEHETRVEIELTHIGKRAAWVSHGITICTDSHSRRADIYEGLYKHWCNSINPCIPGRTEKGTEERKKTAAILRDRKLDNFLLSTKTV